MSCFKGKLCLRKFVYWPGILEACLHCLYTGFFVIEAATYGLILEQKFHGVLQIVLINFYLVLLCLVFIRWNMDMDSVMCQLLVSILSFILTLFVGKLILMYIDYMERPKTPNITESRKLPPPLLNNHPRHNMTNIHHFHPAAEDEASNNDDLESFPKKVSVSSIMKLDPLIVILDICVYMLISISYIIMLLKISFKLRSHSKMFNNLRSLNHNNPSTFYEINSSDGSIVSSSVTMA